MEKIWIHDNWYIPVDENGLVQGPCFEGMLGCVIQIKYEKPDPNAPNGIDTDVAAMKIPRLLADTLEENAYICRMTEDEENEVTRINKRGEVAAVLLAAQFFADNPLLKRRTTTSSDNRDAVAQAGHVIFVSFQRDQKPKFFSVNWNDDKLCIVPKSCKEEFEENVSKDDWEAMLRAASQNEKQPFGTTLYRWHDASGREPVGYLKDVLSTQQVSKVVYAAVPCIIFSWAQGNLQEAITKGETKKWTLDQHFSLFEKILRGVCFLHSAKMIHGDIRPANVMRLGEQHPENYRLGDYGSFGREWRAFSQDETPSGHTQVGPAIGRLRDTPFYSPERRGGLEFESANAAIIKRLSSSGYLIMLGWRSELLTENDKISAKVSETIEKLASMSDEQLGQFDNAQLRPGDRLRIRNYLFEVMSAGVENGLRFYRCSPRYAEILHDHLIVYKEASGIDEFLIVDLSNYVEFYQWSAATDLYSVGAVCLYAIFAAGIQVDTDTASENRDLDGAFVEMIKILGSIPYFQFFWKDLEQFRSEIEKEFNKKPQPSSGQAARSWVGKGNLFDMALNVTNNILQSTPAADVILNTFKRNLAHFLLFMHFILACIHRQDYMTTTTVQLPFSEHRAEPPTSNGAASRALERFLTIRKYLAHNFFDGFLHSDKDERLAAFNPRADFQVKIEFAELKNSILQLEAGFTGPLISGIPQVRQLIDKVKLSMEGDQHEEDQRR